MVLPYCGVFGEEVRSALPYRGVFGQRRPAELSAFALPPASMPARHGLRPLKAWRYVGVYGPQLMLCVCTARIGPLRQSFWAVWDRVREQLRQRTVTGRGGVTLDAGRVRVIDDAVALDLTLAETAGIETVCRSGQAYGWTRKQGAVPARGTIEIAGEQRVIEALAIIDDTAAYYERHTRWRWSAGVGTMLHLQPVAWNLVSGVNDPPTHSERTVWIDGRASEVAPVAFAADLSGVGALRFQSEAVRERRDNLLLVRSSYRQPFGTFSGTLPDGTELSEGYGVMEDHDVWW